MAQKWRKKIILAKIETTYGTDPTPDGANAILAVEVQLTPMEGSDRDRDLETPYLGSSGMIASELHQKLSFKVEMVGQGTAGTVPGWGVLMRACACAETIVPATSVTYNPVTDDHESVTFYVWIDSTLYAIPGSRGTVRAGFTAQQIPYLEFEFTGLFVQPVEAARVTPNLSGFQKPQLATKVNTPTVTLDGTAFVTRSMMLNLANEVEPRFLIGAEEILIVDRADVLDTTVEAVPLTSFDPYQLALTQSTVPIVMTHGTIVGRIVTVNIPQAEMQRPQGLENAQNIVEWPLRFLPLPDVGNDQWTMVLT